MTLTVTPSGRAIARSGLLPLSADELLRYFSTNSAELVELMLRSANPDAEHSDDFAFILIHAALSSSEFGGRALGARRFLPYQLADQPLDGPHVRVAGLMFPAAEVNSTNGAVLSTRWVAGIPIRDVETALEIRSGTLTAMFLDAANILRGLADILYAVTSAKSVGYLPDAVAPSTLKKISALIGPTRRLAMRLDVGLPEDVMWLNTVADANGNVLNRAQIMSLRVAEFVSPDRILDPGRFPQLLAALGPISATVTSLAQRLQSAVRSWRLSERERLFEVQLKRLPAECKSLLQRYYRSTGTEFEHALEEALACIGIQISARDDGARASFPDLVTPSLPPGDTSIECKSKTVGDSVTFNDATDVIRKAAVNGLSASFKITVCQPYISPDVPRKLDQCNELCVVNADDLAEALVRVKVGKLTISELADWLRRPG